MSPQRDDRRTEAGSQPQDYSSVTETPETLVSHEAVNMLHTRYAFAAPYCRTRSVLEVGCGTGAGLGLLAATAKRVVGGDYTEGLLRQAHIQYGRRVSLVRLHASHLPFAPGSFDVILLFEAIYFLPDVEAFLDESSRLLPRGGFVLIVTVNPQWRAFNPSPLSTRYWSAAELDEVCRRKGFFPQMWGGFPTRPEGVRDLLVGGVKRIAVSLNLIPKTMKGKEALKRLAFGRLEPFPAEIPSRVPAETDLVPLTTGVPCHAFKILYVAARREPVS